MKRFFSFMMVLTILFSGCNKVSENEIIQEGFEVQETAQISAVWIFYNELSMVSENGGTEQSFRSKIEKMFDNCILWGINTVFLQVRPCADSFYNSEIFPWTYYLTGEQGKPVFYDPLQICVEEAHERKLSIHAWVNPFRIAFNDDITKLSEDHPAKKWINQKSEDIVFINGGIYFSPASLNAQKLVFDGVREIIRNYDIDGIHIDDYFYPSTDEMVDAEFYNAYVEKGGKLNLSEWRLNTVSAFVLQMYNVVKNENSECVFSISPAGNIQNNYDQQYADVKLWCSQKGYADWIIPQLYYGFENDSLPFDKALAEWNDIHSNPDIKMIYGIAAYKVNDSDDEWISGKGIINKQIELVNNIENSCGVAYFSYSSLVDKNRSAEFQSLGTTSS